MPDDATIEIKRYPNRRYYARNTSSYVSLQDIEDMVKAGHTVEIRDSQTGDDLTRTVLTQLIIQRHPDRMALLPTDFLHHMLRSNEAIVNVMREYFQQSLSWFDFLRQHSPAAAPMSQPLQWFRQWIDTLNPAAAAGNPPAGTAAAEAAATESAAEAAAAESAAGDEAGRLRARIADLESRIADMERDS